MTGGDPPLPPSRTPYSWQGRPYRRRGGPPTSRAPWARRPRSPPTSLRSRHPRSTQHKHHRHLPQPHPTSQSIYHHHTPPLSRNLQARLRSPPRSPGPRRLDLPPHRPDSHRPDQHRPLDRSQDRQQERANDQIPYRGEPGPSHRVDNSDNPSYRTVDRPNDLFPPRGIPSKSRGELSSYRSEHGVHRPSGDHHLPYRGEPGPLYRADAVSHRDDMDRRAVTESGSGRGDSSAYLTWFRNPSKIHKPGKKKVRRYMPHMLTAGRPMQMSKPESPILSRIGYHPVERRQDSGPGQSRSAGIGGSGKWLGDGSSRYGGSSPRVYDRGGGRRVDKGGRHASVLGGVGSGGSRGDGDTSGEHSKSPTGDGPVTNLLSSVERVTNFSKGFDDIRIGTHASALRKSVNACNGKGLVCAKASALRREVVIGRKQESPRRSGQTAVGIEGGVIAMQARGCQMFQLEPNIGSKGKGDPLNSTGACTESKDKQSTEIHSYGHIGKRSSPSTASFQGKEGSMSLVGRRDNAKREIAQGLKKRHESTRKLKLGTASAVVKMKVDGKMMKESIAASQKNAPLRSNAAQSHYVLPTERARPAVPAPSAGTDLKAPANTLQVAERHGILGSASVKAIGQKSLEYKEPSALALEERLTMLGKSSVSSGATPSEMEVFPAQSRPPSQEAAHGSLDGKGTVKTSSSMGISLLPSTPLVAPSVLTYIPGAVLKKRSELEQAEVVENTNILVRAKPLVGKENKNAKRTQCDPTERAALETTAVLPKPASLPNIAATATSGKPPAPVLPIVELRRALSSKGVHGSLSTLNAIRISGVLPGLRSALQSSATIGAVGDPTMAATLGSEPHPSAQSSSQSPPIAPSPVPRSPVSVPAPAISFLRSSPRPRPRSSVIDNVTSPQRLQIEPTPSSKPEILFNTGESNTVRPRRHDLVAKMYVIEERIRAVERELAQKRALKLSSLEPSNTETRASTVEPSGMADNDKILCEMAKVIAERDPGVLEGSSSDDPSYTALRLVITRNRAKSEASTAMLHHLCHDVKNGLTKSSGVTFDKLMVISDELRGNITAELTTIRNHDVEKRNGLSREYGALRESWLRKLKSARDKKSKEKRESIKERDRFLVLSTKGQSALLSSRTSSGRMSMKIIPSLNSNGQMNGNAEVDALLAEIAAEGGTPGLKDIWSKTLAEIPVQNPSRIPCDNGSVLLEDPLMDYQTYRFINPWRFEEVLIFLDKFVTYPKNFRKIARFLDHKSTQDCSSFYYLNKLGLGLKQLLKEASTLKRKGILKSHLVIVAKKRLYNESAEVISFVTSAFLSFSQASGGGPTHEKGHNHPELSSLVKRGDSMSLEKRLVPPLSMTVKKRIISEIAPLDLSEINREAFTQAIIQYGTNWREISNALSLPGKSTSHYREYYRRHKRRLRIEESEKIGSMRNGPTTRSPTPALRPSPRVSPKSSPKSFCTPPGSKLSSEIEPEPMLLDDGIDVTLASKESRKTGSPIMSSPRLTSLIPTSTSPMEIDSKPGSGHVLSGQRSNVKTASWNPEECERFKQLFKKYGRDWKKIAQLLPPKTATQVKGYWRKVAHEVGNGLAGDCGRISKSERKKAKRSYNSDMLPSSDGKRHGDRKSSPAKKCNFGTRDGPKRRSDQVENMECNEKDAIEHLDKEDALVMASGPRVRTPKSSEMVSESQNIGKEKSGNEGEEKNSIGSGAVIRTPDVHGLSIAKPPMLRSAPVPLLRSVPFSDASNSAVGRSIGNSLDGGLRVEKQEDENSKESQLRRAAKSYGVLELMDEKLKGCSEKGKDE